ncbi:MAG: HNH endonuclease [Xanthomonadaceae bacterium]|nr:HNH endonuclease [Xanthomonadaceae bacterium]
MPAKILHQVNLRDQRRCNFINTHNIRCNQTRWIEIHHLLPVSQGGTHALENLTTLCSSHHKLQHINLERISLTTVNPERII